MDNNTYYSKYLKYKKKYLELSNKYKAIPRSYPVYPDKMDVIGETSPKSNKRQRVPEDDNAMNLEEVEDKVHYMKMYDNLLKYDVLLKNYDLAPDFKEFLTSPSKYDSQLKNTENGYTYNFWNVFEYNIGFEYNKENLPTGLNINSNNYPGINFIILSYDEQIPLNNHIYIKEIYPNDQNEYVEAYHDLIVAFHTDNGGKFIQINVPSDLYSKLPDEIINMINLLNQYFQN